MSDRKPWEYVLDSPADVWSMAEFLSTSTGEDGEVVVLDDREIPATQLVDVWRWLFDK